jgi:GR25 family glycosyltransferase involved in LPS biosynthesis
MQSLIIHMSSATARRANVDRLLADLPDARVIEAVTGQGVTTAPGNLHQPHYPFPMGNGEIGCTLSHRKCWQHIVDSGAEYALIAEDDLQIDTAVWPNVMTLIAAHMTPDHFIRLPAKAREIAAQDIACDGLARLFLPKVIGLQTVCQVVGSNAARRLLDATKTLDRPVDTFLQMHWVHGQPIHTILPNGVAELTADLGGSTIQKKTRTSGKLMREIRRFRYRRAVNARPQS